MEIIFYHPTLIPNTGSVSWKSSYPARGCASGKRAITGRRTMPGLASAGRDAAGPGAEGRVRPRGRGGLYSPASCATIRYAAAVDSAVSSRRYRYGTADAGVCREPVLHWFRRFDDYQALKLASRWQPPPEYRADEFTVGIMGAGVLGGEGCGKSATLGFPLRVWSRSRKSWPQVQSFAGQAELGEFLQGTRVLINLLPNTAETAGIITRRCWRSCLMRAMSSTLLAACMSLKRICWRR